MREQITFAVDANGFSYYVGVSDKMKKMLSIQDQGAGIDDWPGDFPGKLPPGFYSASIEVSGASDSPDIKWRGIQKLTAHPPWVKVTRVPAEEEVEAKARKRKQPEKILDLSRSAEPQIRIRRKGEVLV